MKILRSALALTLSLLLLVESTSTLSYASPAASPLFRITLPGSLGYISETYSPHPESTGAAPEMIFIQDLHANRSVQFAISGILKKLKTQGLMPDRIAVEGETGPVDIASMQNYPDSAVRKSISNYLVEQAEMPGAMHFVVTEGAGGLFGIETDEYYQANLEMFRRSYAGRAALRSEIDTIQAVLPRLKKERGAAGENAAILEKDLTAVSRLINNQVIPDELPATLAQAGEAVNHLKQVLPRESSAGIVTPLSASVNFYALALLRNEELFKNTLAARELGHQKTSIVVTGGFHTAALAREAKQRGMSYAVITPNVRRHDKVDERLYVERLLDHHLTPAQAGTGLDWASAMTMIMFRERAASLFSGILSAGTPRRWPLRRKIVTTAIVVACATGLGGCHRSPTAPGSDDGPGQIDVGITAPSPSEGTVLAPAYSSSRGSGGRITFYADGDFTVRSQDDIQVVFLPTNSLQYFMFQMTQKLPGGQGIENPNIEKGLMKQVLQVPAPPPPQLGYAFNRVAMRFKVNRAAMGLDENTPVGELQVHAGSEAYEFTLNPPGGPGSNGIPFDRIDRYNGPAWQTGALFPLFEKLMKPFSPTVYAASPEITTSFYADSPHTEMTASGYTTYKTLREDLLQKLPDSLALEAHIPTVDFQRGSPDGMELVVYALDEKSLNNVDIEFIRGSQDKTLHLSTSKGQLTALTGSLAKPEDVTSAGPGVLRLHIPLDPELENNQSPETLIRVTPSGPAAALAAPERIVSKTSKLRAGALFVIALAAGMAVLGLHQTPLYAAELGLGSNASVAHSAVQTAVHAVNMVSAQHEVHQTMFNQLLSTLSSVSLKSKAVADAIFRIPVGIGVLVASGLVGYRLKKKLETLRAESAIWAAA